MTRTRILGLALLVVLIAVWKLSPGGDPDEPAVANPPSVVEASGDRAAAPLEGVSGEPLARVEAGPDAETMPRVDEETATDAEESSVPAPSGARVRLVGRVLDAAGNAVAERAFECRFQVHRGMSGPTHFTGDVTTDADGRFRQDVDDAWLEAGAPLTLQLEDARAPAAARAIFVLPNHFDDGEHDLGEAQIHGPVTLAGRAIDGSGGAVEAADVWVRWAQRVTVPPGADPERYQPEIWWMLDDLRARSSESGEFELVGFAPAAPLRVEARKEGHLDAESVACEVGATDVEVVLRAGGRIAGRVLVDEGIPIDRFQVEVRVGEGMDGFRRLTLDADGAFEAEGLPPGQGLVSLVLKPDSDTLLEIDDVDVASAPDYRDVRLDPVDLRGKVTTATVTVLGAAGELLDTAEGRVVGLHFPDTSSREYAPRPTAGVLSLIGMGDGLDVQVWATGYRARVLTGVRDDVEARLEVGTPVRAELSSPPLEEGESLSLMLEVEEEYWRQVAATPIAPGGVAELAASHDGRHQLSLWLEIKTAESSGRIRIQDPEAALELDVVQGEATPTPTIVLTEAALAAARKSWRRFR